MEKSSTRLNENRKNKLLAIQQRENLKAMILSKFQQKYQKKHFDTIIKEVNEFMKSGEINEQSLQSLEGKIAQLCGKQLQPTNEKQQQPKEQDQKSQKSQKSMKDNVSQNSQAMRNRNPDNISITSSQKPKSVYQLNDVEDEWATIVKFDSELFKKEQELENLRSKEQKKKYCNELQKQIQQKILHKHQENDEDQQYAQLLQLQMQNFDEREQLKLREKLEKIDYEKKSRDKQLDDENRRKRDDKKRQKELDTILVQRIKEEEQEAESLQLQRKVQSIEHFKRLKEENEANKTILNQRMVEEKHRDIEAQQNYCRLLDEQEKARQEELQRREQKAFEFINQQNDTVVKEQRKMIEQEQQKIYEHMRLQEVKLLIQQREMQEDQENMKFRQKQKQYVRQYLDKQVEEKQQKKNYEDQLDVKQAEFWKQDTDKYKFQKSYYDHDRQRQNIIKDTNKRHQEILMQQMMIKNSQQRHGHKMIKEELLQNKDIIKKLADGHELQRQLIE